MVRNESHGISLRQSLLQAMFEGIDKDNPHKHRVLNTPVERAAALADQILERLEYCERLLIEVLFGLGDGHQYSYEEAAHIFQILPQHMPYEVSRILSKCLQVLEHIGV